MSKEIKKEKEIPYYEDATIICVCGNITKTGSTKKETHVELCANCHPFFTGKQKVIDTAGRVDRFKKRAQQATTKIKKRKMQTRLAKAQALAREAKKVPKTKKNETKLQQIEVKKAGGKIATEKK